MKIFFYFVFVCMFLFPFGLIGKAQDEGIILCTSKGKHLTESHVEIVVMAIEKQLSRSLTPDEFFLIKKNVRKEFIKNPIEMITSIENISGLLQNEFLFFNSFQQKYNLDFEMLRLVALVSNP